MSACAQTKSTIRESLERLRPNVHSCLIYETPEEQLAAAVPFLELGLKRGEQCIYLGDETSAGQVLNAMGERGIDTNVAIQSGSLTVIPTPAIPGSGGPAAALALLAEAGRAANGAGVRLARQITCEAGQLVDQKQIDEYERQVASCFTGKKYVDVALYHRQSVPPQVLLNVIRSRPVVIWDGTVCNNLHAAQPNERLAPDPTADEVERVLANLRDRQRIEDGLREKCRNAAILPVESLLSGAPTDSSPSGCGTCLSQISSLQEQILYSEKMEALGRMAAVTVHRFDDALATIKLCTDLLIHKLGPDVSRLNLAKRILTECQNAAALTNQLRPFVRSARTQAEPLDLNSVISELEGVIRSSLKEQFDLRIIAVPAACPVKFDRGQLEQVILDLVLNACDAMPQGGTITIQTSQTLQNVDETVGPCSPTGPLVTLSVTDTGLGMDANARKRVFDPFFTIKDPGQGAGLGLSIVYAIVQKQFGGTISVESRPGMGTTVTVSLPRAEKLPD
jgi:signal transduction histidine kinase